MSYFARIFILHTLATLSVKSTNAGTPQRKARSCLFGPALDVVVMLAATLLQGQRESATKGFDARNGARLPWLRVFAPS